MLLPRHFYWLVCWMFFLAWGETAGWGQEKPKAAGRGYPPTLPNARVEVYKTIGDTKLKMYIFTPRGWQAADRRPAVVFFFGGGWRNGSPGQFEHQCEYLAERGMVAMTADYRVASRQDAKVVDCVRDAKSAIRWARKEAARLGIDPQRIAAGGGSAGGHLAACTGVLTGLDEPTEDLAISSRPDALVLFNPAVVLAAIPGQPSPKVDRTAELRERMGVDPESLSPYHHVKSGAPPTIIFHGKDDTTVPYATVEAFSAAMKQAGNRCELQGYAGQKHGFFNYDREGHTFYQQTVESMDKFFVSLGYLLEKRP